MGIDRTRCWGLIAIFESSGISRLLVILLDNILRLKQSSKTCNIGGSPSVFEVSVVAVV